MKHESGFVLTPVSSIVQFRPTFNHVSTGLEDKQAWKPVRINPKEQAKLVADELLRPNTE